MAPALDGRASAYLGKENAATVYAAKLAGILMGLDLAMKFNQRNVAVFTDNQAALQALESPRRQSGQFILIRIIQALAEASLRGISVEFHWIPAHQAISGNEMADKLAKEATGWRQSQAEEVN